MTLLHIIKIAGEVVFFYTLWMCLLGLTFVLMDQFEDWYRQFKQSRKDKVAKNNEGRVAK
jgi:hypothetical protein